MLLPRKYFSFALDPKKSWAATGPDFSEHSKAYRLSAQKLLSDPLAIHAYPQKKRRTERKGI